MRLPATASALLCVLLLSSGGCASIEGSFQSSSDSLAGAVESLASPFESSSTSSGSRRPAAETRTSYLRDVRAYTLVYLQTPGSAGEFARGLSRVAATHGINDWEADRATFAAIDAATADTRFAATARERLRQEVATLSRRS